MARLLKAEFHCHTRFSHDSLVEVVDLIETARRCGLEKLVITDHNTIQGGLAAQRLDPELIIIGEEILTTRGELLAFFVKEEIPKGLEPGDAIRRLRDQDAFISVSHPFDIQRHGWRIPDLQAITPLVDAIEVFNARCLVNNLNDQALAYAQKNNLAGTVGSDAHALFEVGRVTLRLPAFSTPEELRVSLRSSQMEGRLSPVWVHWTSTYAKFIKRIQRT